ncbi:MAG: putative OsmC-like protein [Polaribacter sp.]
MAIIKQLIKTITMENPNLETFKAEALGIQRSTKVSITDTEWTILVDEPKGHGGSGTGANPMQYFTASLAGCQNEQAQVVAGELSLKIDQIDMKVETDLDLSGFMGEAEHSNGSYKNVRLETVVTGDVTDEQVKLLGQKVDARCPILALLRSGGCKVESSWTKK